MLEGRRAMLIHLHEICDDDAKNTGRAAIQASAEPAWALADRFGSAEDQETIR